jgi:ABC-type lipoprotein export system ATPase subunit
MGTGNGGSSLSTTICPRSYGGGRAPVLDGVSLENVREREFLAIVGPSGSGKNDAAALWSTG